MALLGYKKQFTPSVKDGSKRSTIRATRKHPVKVGEKLYHYTGLRTKQCEKLLESVCTETYPVRIIHETGIGATPFERAAHRFRFFINNIELSKPEIEELARTDGCGMGWLQFITLFEEMHSFPFEGQIIYW
jgi:hypothetical protein